MGILGYLLDKRFIVICVIVLFTFTCIYNLSVQAENLLTDRKAAIIIDDFGGVAKGTQEFLESDIPITVAVMPFLEQSTEIAEQANELGFEVIIHLPMEPKKGKRSWLGPNPITSDLSQDEVKQRVEEAIENVPHAKGINQHMGSKIVEEKETITTILNVIKDHDLYIVDSGTNPHSYISDISEQLGVPFAKRDLFLDNTLSSEDHVYDKAIQLADLATKGGSVIGIGHVGIHGIETYQALEKAHSYFIDNRVDIVPTSQLIKSDIDKNPDNFWSEY
ncbi:divergent polysaccharide deacetylase family protein [Salipaludibacillus daqingensis]|uniref:divergent polysaccharide deacetylase family protein n=1 Tax=Salipaludibacillus daqingensis TaxID=3041001 RepID=UPI0024772C3F|nr:divergent polysaccharide deacetylase family protein [Salipaludibacillus daqingensis]